MPSQDFFTNLNRSIVAFAFCCLGAGIYVGLKSVRSSTAAQAENKVIVVGMCAEYKPYEYKNEHGGVEGFDVDLAKEIARRMKKQLVIKDLSFDSLILSLKNGSIDMIISAMSITHDRLKTINMIPYFGEPVTKLALILWGRDPFNITKIEDLKTLKAREGLYKDPTIAVQTGTIQADYIVKVPYVKPRMLDTPNDVILDLQYRKSIAAFARHDMAYQLKKQYPESIKIIDVPLPESDWVLGDGIGIRKDKKELYEQVTQIIRTLEKEGFIAGLAHKWLRDVV